MAGKPKPKKNYSPNNSTRLRQRVNAKDDHVLGNMQAPITLVEYGSYFSSSCHAAHEVISNLRDQFGDQLRYVYRHLPLPGHERAKKAAILAEYAAETTGNFWEVHDALMDHESKGEVDIEKVAEDFNLPMPDTVDNEELETAKRRVEDDIHGAQESGALLAPTFYINDRLYEGPWDESSLSEVMKGAPGFRVKAAALDFVRWGPSAGIALIVMVILALVLANSASYGTQFLGFWEKPFGFRIGASSFDLPLIKWINDGLLSIFFLVVGLEVKREFTVGSLTKPRAAGLPLVGSLGGVVVPALIYLLIVPFGPLSIGWGTTISTDTAFVVVNKEEALMGIVKRKDIFSALNDDQAPIASILMNKIAYIYPYNDLGEAVDLMDKYSTDILPVVRPGMDHKVIGVLTHKNIFMAYHQRRNEDEISKQTFSFKQRGIRIILRGRQLFRWEREHGDR